MAAKGKTLKNGGGIGIVAPSSPSQKDRLAAGAKKLSSLGFSPLVIGDPSINYSKYGALFASDTPAVRVANLTALYSNRDVAAILAARGAYGALEILPLIDWKIATQNPKPVIGCSDVTAVLIALFERAGIVTIHGPTLESSFSKLGADTPDPDATAIETSVHDLIGMLQGTPIPPRIFSSHVVGTNSSATNTEGELIGGNLTTITSMMGTPWEPSFDQRIVFFEDVGERPYRIHRMLLQLKLAGKMRNVRAVLLGSFRNCDAQGPGPDLAAVFADIFAGAGFPVLQGGSFGHDPLNLSMPLGIKARVAGLQLELLEGVMER